MSDLVSIIIPTFDRAHLIAETLDSILAQTHQNWECIIVDDGSTDNTEELIATYIAADSRFQFFNRPSDRPKGGNACRNYGFEKSKGDFVNWFDSDDIMLPIFLQEKVQLMQNSTFDASICYGAYFEGNKNRIDVAKPRMDSTSYLIEFVTNTMFLSIAAPLWQRDFLSGKKLFDESRYKMQDVEFHFRMLLNNVKFTFYESTHLYLIRRGDDRLSITSGLNVKSLTDVFLYHYATFTHSHKVESNYRISYSKFTARKTLRSYYEICLVNTSLCSRLRSFMKFRKTLFSVVDGVEETWAAKSKYVMGLFGTTVFRRGFKFFE